MASDIADPGLAADGRARIDWADAQMPVLRSIAERFAPEQPLAGVKVGVVQDIEIIENTRALVTFTVQSNVVMRRQVLIDAGGFPEDELFRRRGGEDVALMQAITRTCRIGTLFTEPGVFYRIRPGCGARVTRARRLDWLIIGHAQA